MPHSKKNIHPFSPDYNHDMMSKTYIGALMASGAFLCTAAAATESPPPTGVFNTSFDKRSELSATDRLVERFGWPKDKSYPDYRLKDETFFVYVPQKYKGDEPYGLLVWISPIDPGQVRGIWKPVLDKHKLIWVGANRAGNPREIWQRLGLAVDAAANMPLRYEIDTKRVYVSGLSGGGRCASLLGVAYPDVFAGAMPIVGCNYFRSIPVPGRPGKFWRGTFRRPSGKLFQHARRQSRFVLLTGETDANRAQTKATYEHGFKRDRFRHVQYIEVPGMGHAAPDAKWFEKGLMMMDGKE